MKISGTRPHRPLRGGLVALVLGLLAVLVLAGCSAGSDDGGSTDSEAAPADAAPLGVAEDGMAATTGAVRQPAGESEPAAERAVISTGNVALRSEDVEKAAFDVHAIADEHAGEVTDSKTTTDDEGEVRLARLVLRVPAADFTDAFEELEEVADLASSSSTSEDVTTEVIDNQVRIRAQRRSLQRIEVLLDRAQSIRDIVAIEAQLTRRQAELDSLEQRQAYLRDQTSMSTITVNIERAEEDEEEPGEEEDDSGFLSGLSAGWSALGTFGTALATLAGAVLPFAVLLALLALPALVLVRRGRRPKLSAPVDG